MICLRPGILLFILHLDLFLLRVKILQPAERVLRIEVHLLVIVLGALGPLGSNPALDDLTPQCDVHPNMKPGFRRPTVPPIYSCGLEQSGPVAAVEAKVDVVLLEAFLVEVEVITV
jgi:hypothetical protein